MRSAIIYLRRVRDSNLPKKIAFCRQYCIENQIDVLGEFIDENRYVGLQSKPQMNLALRALSKADLFISYEFRDWIIDASCYTNLIDKIVGANKNIISLAEGFDTSTIEGKAQALLLKSFEIYWRTAFINPTALTENELTKKISEYYYNYDMRMAEIARALSHEKIVNPNGKPWHRNHVREILNKCNSGYDIRDISSAHVRNKKITLQEL